MKNYTVSALIKGKGMINASIDAKNKEAAKNSFQAIYPLANFIRVQTFKTIK